MKESAPDQLNIVDDDGNTPLSLAIIDEQTDIAIALINILPAEQLNQTLLALETNEEIKAALHEKLSQQERLSIFSGGSHSANEQTSSNKRNP